MLGGGEEGIERIVRGNDEAGDVRKKLTAEVEDDKEEVEGDDANNSVGLGDRGTLLEVIESGVFGKLMVRISHKSESR